MYKRIFILVLSVAALVSCSRDPQVVKKRYLESGNKYFERGKLKEASIMYRRALSTDAKYGEAWYRFALVNIKLGQIANSVPAFRRAVELLPKNSADWNDSNLHLAEIFLLAAQSPGSTGKNQQLLSDVEVFSKQFLAQNFNSFEGHKLQADLFLVRALDAFKINDIVNSKKLTEQAIAEYRHTLDIKPGEASVEMSLARTLSLYGESGEAEQLFKKVIDQKKLGTNGYLELYRLYSAQKKPDEAEAILKRAIADNPKAYEFQTILAAHYFTNGKRPEGARILDDLKANFREYPQAYFTAGDFYLRVNDSSEAIKQYEEGIKKDGAHKIDYQKRIIEAYIHDNKTAQAYERNLEILKENPKDPEARGLKASFLLDKGDINQAINELQAVVTARPDNFVARFHLGRAHFAKGEYEQARQQFEKAIDLKPDYLPPRLALSQVALARGDNTAALKYAEDSLRMNVQSGAARLLQSAALMRLNRFGDSRTTLNALLAANPKQPETLLEIGVLDLMEKKYQEASDVFRRAYDSEPGNARGLLGQAESLILLGKPADALKLIADESLKYPKRMDLKHDLADMEVRTGNLDRAISDYKGLVDSNKDSPRQQGEIYARMGETFSRMKDYPKSIEAFKKAKDLIPDNVVVLNNLALILDNTGEHVEARKTYENSISKDPNNAEALNNLAYLMAETGGNLDEALTLANRAKQKLPNLMEISDTIGWIYLKKGLSDNAVDIFRDLTAKVPANSTYHFHYAMALAQKGDKPAATKQCQLALANKPTKEEESRIRELMTRI
jgi:tetratricopeptide (TPR) repeat protein